MATPAEKLAESLDELKALQDQGHIVIRSSELSRTHQERLFKNGYLQRVIKGWYIPTRPDEAPGESTAWFASFWKFCTTYLKDRFDTDWCLSPDQSLLLHVGNFTVPRQLIVRSTKGRNKVTQLPHHTSLLDTRSALPEAQDIEGKMDLRLYTLAAALVACSHRFFTQYPTDARAALAMIQDASQVLDRLLEGGHSRIASRLAGAFRNVGRGRIADDIINTMRAADYDMRETDPFGEKTRFEPLRERSPYVNRIRLMWQAMREPIRKFAPSSSKTAPDIDSYIERVEEAYVTDAYHSLSIEGYRVSPELIEKVRSGTWHPDKSEEDREQRNALAARGYWQAFQSVKESVRRVLKGANPGQVADEDHGTWYREMFGPSVTAGILKPAELAGYRNDQVYIRRSKHVPPNKEAMRDSMPAFFELLREETDPFVRVVLGHFVFVYIHPYMDGNGRMARFLMNVMLAAGGYPWTVIKVDDRDTYMEALEAASVGQDIEPFAKFLSDAITDVMRE